VGAVLAARDMPAERRRAAALDGRHDLELAEAHMAGMGSAPRGPVAAEDIRDLERRAGNGAARYAGGVTVVTRHSSGLVISPRALRATRV
jgi:hypothetical protein